MRRQEDASVKCIEDCKQQNPYAGQWDDREAVR